MSKIIMSFLIAMVCVFVQNTNGQETKLHSLESTNDLELLNVKAEPVEYMGKKGIEVTKADGEIKGETLIIIPETDFKNGTISLELTGEPAADAAPQMRGFVGVAFRVNPSDYSSYECFYLRPTNARANNQLQRNHTTQYVSHPEFPWHRLRRENPGLNESYIDMVLGEWTKIKIEVSGKTAKLFLHEAEQPCLIINELKHDETTGNIGLWLHSSTLARFRNLEVSTK
jgi:3-keto-disaccharide hydrolase